MDSLALPSQWLADSLLRLLVAMSAYLVDRALLRPEVQCGSTAAPRLAESVDLLPSVAVAVVLDQAVTFASIPLRQWQTAATVVPSAYPRVQLVATVLIFRCLRELPEMLLGRCLSTLVQVPRAARSIYHLVTVRRLDRFILLVALKL
jgi:hypothetical protein